MARLPRLTLPGMVHHVVLRGNNRQPVFLDGSDRESFLALLVQYAAEEAVQLHAYVLMDNHIHLLLTPKDGVGVARLMQGVGRAYVRRFNQRHGRSGTLWEGRFRSTVIDADLYLLPSMVFMDLNPVRAGMVQAPELYPWSSHAHYVGRRHEAWLSPHPLVWGLGNTPFAREAAYAELVKHGIPKALEQRIAQSALSGWVLGEGDFLAGVGELTERRLMKRKPGRPVQKSENA